MSTSDHLLLVQENQEDIEFNLLLKKPKFNFQENIHRCKQEEEPKKRDSWRSPESSEKELRASNDDDDSDDDGFKTPTSLDHKIPASKKCPPAPSKPSKTLLFQASKGKSSNVRTSRQLDLSQEVEFMFPKPILDDFYRKIKKARRD